MNLIKETVVNYFEDVMNWEIDLDSWAGLHFIQFCKEQNYENPSVEVFTERFAEDENVFDDVEKIGFKYRTFADKYLSASEKESFLHRVYTAHYEHFQNQTVRGFEA